MHVADRERIKAELRDHPEHEERATKNARTQDMLPLKAVSPSRATANPAAVAGTDRKKPGQTGLTRAG